MRFSTPIFHSKWNYLAVFCVLINVGAVHAQSPYIQWQSTYGGSGNDYGYYIQQTNDSGFITIGTTYSTDGQVTEGNGIGDTWVMKLSKSGSLIWEKCFGNTDFNEGSCIQQTTDGGYIMIGYVYTSTTDVGSFGEYDIKVIKLNSSGGIVWQHFYGGSGSDFGYFIQQTMDGGYIFTGGTSSHDGEVTGYRGGYGSDYWVVKINNTGTIVWEKTFGGYDDDYATMILQTPDSGFIVAGSTSSSDEDIKYYHGGYYDYWILKLNNTGAVTWQRTYGGSFDDEATAVALANDGNYIVTGISNSSDGDITGNLGGYDFWTLKLDTAGNILWNKNYGGSSDDGANFIQQTTDNGFIMSGFTNSSDKEVTNYYGNQDMWIVKTDSTGNLQWQKNLGGDTLDNSECITQTFDGGFATIGATASDDDDVTFNYGGKNETSDIWVVKLGSAPNSVASIKKSDDIEVYPTPTNGIVNIKMPEGYEDAQFRLYNIAGQPIDIPSTKGLNRRLYLNDIPPGIYFLQIINQYKVTNFNIIYQ